jgi:polyisoprenoid-binding protein YceI
VVPVAQKLDNLSTLDGSWTIDPARTSVEFHTRTMWLVTVKGTLKVIDGRGSVGPDGAVGGTLVLDAASIDTHIAKRDAHLRSADFLDAATHPTIVFVATGARPVPSGQIEVIGTLTVRGVTRPLTILADVHTRATELTVSTAIDIDRTAWEVGRPKVGLGLASRVSVNACFVKV